VHKLAGQTLADFPQTSRWYAAIRARAAVERGVAVLRDTWVDIRKDEQAAKVLFGSGRAGDG
jgi:hypothetical protein